MRKLLISAAAALLSASAIASVAAARTPAKNVVLVHGAFVDETSWQPVADLLTKRGYHVTLVKNPLTSLEDDVKATREALARQSGPTVLVGHSWGGVVITEAGEDPKVTALVYVSAFAPEKGESVAGLGKNGTQTEGIKSIRADQKGFLTIDPQAFPKVIAADLPDSIGQALAKSQLPLNHVSFETAVTNAAWQHKPSYYVVSTEDKLLDPRDQHFFADRIKAQTIELKGSHASLVVHAKDVADIIEKAASSK
jgi:pimeloyl-ACP methyl ester carboxylesterase